MGLFEIRGEIRGFCAEMAEFTKKWDGKGEVTVPNLKISEGKQVAVKVRDLAVRYDHSTEKSRLAFLEHLGALEETVEHFLGKIPDHGWMNKVSLGWLGQENELRREFETASQAISGAKERHTHGYGQNIFSRWAGHAGRKLGSGFARGIISAHKETFYNDTFLLKKAFWQVLPHYQLTGGGMVRWLSFFEGTDWIANRDRLRTVANEKSELLNGSTFFQVLRSVIEDLENLEGKTEKHEMMKQAFTTLFDDQTALKESELQSKLWIADVLEDYIYKKQDEIIALKEGVPLFICSGCVGHAIYLKVCRTGEAFSITVYNTGLGADKGQNLLNVIQGSVKIRTFRNVPLRVFEDFALLQKITTQKWSIEEMEEQFFNRLIKEGATCELGSRAMLQFLGSCVYSGIELLLKDNLSEEEFDLFVTWTIRQSQANIPTLVGRVKASQGTEVGQEAERIAKLLLQTNDLSTARPMTETYGDLKKRRAFERKVPILGCVMLALLTLAIFHYTLRPFIITKK